MATRPRIEVRQLWKRFQRGPCHHHLRDLIGMLLRGGRQRAADLDETRFWALRDVSFAVEAGEALGIIGPNGAGKSTLLKVLARVLRPDRGSVRLEGRLGTLIELAAGFHPDLTGRENIFLGGAILGMRRRDIERRLDAIIDFAGIEPFIDTPVKRYSSGMQARLGFAVAAHLEPDVLLVDEVLSVGDSEFQRRCVATMKERVRQGVAVLFISHHIPTVLELCPRSLVLDRGSIVFAGPSDRATARHLELLRRDGPDRCAAVELVGCRFAAARSGPLAPGDRFCFEVRLRCRAKVEQPALHFVIHRHSDHLPVCEVAADRCGLARRSYGAGEEVTLRLTARAHLVRGHYMIGLRIGRSGDALLERHCLHTFEVEETVSVSGVANLDMRIEEGRTETHAGCTMPEECSPVAA